MAHHEGFGELLTSFELGSCQRGTDHRNVADLIVFMEEISNTPYQRFLRTYDHEVDVIRQYELLNGTEVVGVDIDIGAALSGAGISRSDEKFDYTGTLCNFTGESVLATSGSQ